MKKIVMLLAAVGLVSIAYASPITVLNASFEEGVPNWDNGQASPPPSWGTVGTAGARNPPPTQIDESTVVSNSAGYASGGELTQALGTNFVSGNLYTLTALVARNYASTNSYARWQLQLQSWDGSAWEVVANQSSRFDNNASYPEDGHLTEKTLKYTAGAASDGKEIRIVLKADLGGMIFFDDIALDVEAYAGVPIANASFEIDLLTWDGSVKSDSVTGWELAGLVAGEGIANPLPTEIDKSTVEGSNVGYGNAGDSALYQSLGVDFASGDTYTLSATIGRRNNTKKGWWQLELQAWDVTNWVAVANAGEILDDFVIYPEDGSMIYHELVYTADAADAGKEIRIALKSSWGVRMMFDDVQLGLVALPKGYDGFMVLSGITNGAPNSAPEEDYDGDGQLNVYEYGLGGNPDDAGDVGTEPTFTYAADNNVSFVNVQLTDPNADITYTVEQTDDLVFGTWTNSGWNLVSTNATADPEFDEVQHRAWGGSKDSLFMRLIITQP